MENEREVIERLERIETKENQRLLMAKIQLALVAVLVIGIAVALCVVLPKANDLYVQASAAITQAQGIMIETEGALTQMDWSQFQELDIEGLNTAIANLNAAVTAMQEKAAEVQAVFEAISQFFSQWFGN